MTYLKFSTIASLSIVALLLTGCTKWTIDISDYPEEFISQQQAQLNESLTSLEDNPEDTKLLLQAAFSYQQLGQYKNAVKYYNQILSIEPNHFQSLNNLADIYEQVKDYSNSAIYIKRLYEANQGGGEVISDTVRILLQAGQVEDAKRALGNYVDVTNAADDPGSVAFITKLYKAIEDYENK